MKPEISSPCTGECTMNPKTGLCNGCRRTLPEIAAWADLDDTAKAKLLDILRGRRARRR